jgi:hypothetical protein
MQKEELKLQCPELARKGLTEKGELYDLVNAPCGGKKSEVVYEYI